MAAKKKSLNLTSPLLQSILTAGTNINNALTTTTTTTGGGRGRTPAQTETAPTAKVKKDALLQWYDVKFYANSKEVRGFTGFTIKGSVEVEQKETGGTKYSKKKYTQGYECSLTAYFDRRLGKLNVKKEAMKLVDYGMTGQRGYLYAQEKKLVTCQMMMTSAKCKNVVMTPYGRWISAEVDITLKTSGKVDGSGSSGGGSGGTGGSGGNGGSNKYKVKIAGMSELTVTASSVQAAITKACGPKYTGYVTVNGKTYYVKNGKIAKAPNNDRIPRPQAQSAVTTSTQQTENAQTTSSTTPSWPDISQINSPITNINPVSDE